MFRISFLLSRKKEQQFKDRIQRFSRIRVDYMIVLIGIFLSHQGKKRWRVDGVHDCVGCQTIYPCSITIPEAQAWLETNSGPGEIGEKMDGGFDLIEKAISFRKWRHSSKKPSVQAQAGLGSLHLKKKLG